MSHVYPAEPAINRPRHQSIHAWLKDRAEHAPHDLALLAPDRTPLTYGRLYQHIEDMIQAFHTMGVGRRDRIALVLPNGPEIASASLAVMACAACAPLDPDYSASEFEFYLRRIDAKALLIQAHMDSSARVAAQAHGIAVIELSPQREDAAGLFTLAGPACRGDVMREYAQPEDIALVLHTSGTVSQPKIVPLTHINLCTATHNLAVALGLAASDRCLNVLPFFHIHALQTVLLASIFTGASMVCPPRFSAPAFFARLEEFRPTWYTAVPSIHREIAAYAEQHPERARRSALRLIRSGSAALSHQVRAGLERAFRASVIETYGATEAAGFMTCNPPPSGPRKAGSVGRAVGPEIAVMDDTGNLLPIGATGEIVARGVSIMPGYENNATANEAVFTDGWYRSGDEGYLDADGYVYVTGRFKEVINRGGRKVSPHEVDDVLLAHPDVAEAATFATPHTRWGEDVASAVVLHPGAASTERDLRRFVAAHLTRFKVPSQILIVNRIPLGPIGKLQRHRLVAQLGLTHATAHPQAPVPLTPLQEVLTGLWATVLDLEDVHLDANFFSLGGDSLVAIRLLSRIHEVTHVDISFPTFFAAPTVAEMAEYIATVQQISSPLSPLALQVVPRCEPLPLSYGQQRLWFLEHLGLTHHAYHLLDAIRLHGPLQVAALEQSLQEIVARHEVLRTTFTRVAGELRQQIDPSGELSVSHQDLRHVAQSERDLRARILAQAAVQPSFDLGHGPLMRVTIMQFDADDHVLCIVMHHIISDGWSRGLFWRELSQLYRGRITGQPASLPTLAIQYADFAHWQQQWLQNTSVQAQLTYWKQQLAGAPMLPLPTDYPRPDVQTFRGARYVLTLPFALTQEMQTLSQRYGVTLFMTLLAAFQMLLHRYAGQDDIVVGSLIAHRHRAELEPLMGFFVNTLVLRTDLSGDPSLPALLVRVRDVALGAYGHKDMPYEKLLEELRPPRDLSRNPIFQVMCVLHNTPEPVPALSGLTASPVEIDPGVARFDLTLDWRETAAGLQCRFEYSTDLFEAATIDRMSRHLQALLEGMVAQPEQRMSQFALLTADERQQLLVEWNATAAPYPDDQCLHDLFESQVTRTPNATAIICGDQAITYHDLNYRANQVAHYLGALGVEPAGLVGLCLDRSLDMVVGLLGILKAGAAYVPLDPAYPAERLALMLADAEPAIVLTQDRCRPLLPPCGAQIVSLEAQASIISRYRGDNPGHRTPADSVAFLLYTSGSTGRPKGVLGGHRATLNVLNWLWQMYPFANHDVCCHHISMSFADATQELLGPLLRGTPTVLIPEAMAIDLRRFVQTLARHRVSRLILVPSLLRTLVDMYGDLQAQLPHLKLWFCGGEVLSHDLYQRFQNALPGSRLINLYGATETSANTTWYDTSTPPGPGASVPLGRPIANTEVYILDANQQPVPIGVAGELYVGGASLTRGYRNQPALTAERWLPHPFSREPGARIYRVGDLARYRANGNIEYLGRLDQQVKVRGMRIELGEIEAALMAHPTLRQTAVIAHQDAPGDTRLIAYLVTVQGRTIPSEELRRFLEKRLPPAWVSVVFVTLTELPLTPSGKVDRRALPRPNVLTAEREAPFVAPRHAGEEAIAAIWRQLLGLGQVGIHDNFFALGGHSLLAMRLLFRVADLTQVEMPLARFLASPTVFDMVADIDTAKQTGTGMSTPPIIPVPRDGALPVTIAQEQLWLLDQVFSELSFFNISRVLRLRGPLDTELLEQSLNVLIARHEVLRSSFHIVDGHLVQVVAPEVLFVLISNDLCHLSKIEQDIELKRLVQIEIRKSFDLQLPPLIRVLLLKLKAEEYVLCIVLHHIICDGLSLDVLIHDLAVLYGAFFTGAPPLLPELSIQYADFAYWQHQWQHHTNIKKQLAYWLKIFQFPAPLLDLPKDRSRNDSLAVHTDNYSFSLSNSLFNRLKNFSHANSCTLFITYLSALKIYLYLASGQEDICIATLTANRSTRETENLVGLFVNTLLLRTDISGNPTQQEVLQRVCEITLLAYQNQDVPFEEVIRALESNRGIDRQSLCQVMLVWQNMMSQSRLFSKCKIHTETITQNLIPFDVNATTFDIVFTLRETPNDLTGTLTYKSDRFNVATISRMVDTFHHTLDNLMTHPHLRLSSLTRLS